MRRVSLYEKNIKTKKEVSEAAFFFLFSEIVQYCLKKDKSTLIEQLEELGYPLGQRFLELLCYKDKSCKKETKIADILWFIGRQVWQHVFGKPITSLEVHANFNHIYMLKEENSLCNKYACLPKAQKGVNCSAYTAGMIEGLLNAAGFSCRVSAVYDNEDVRGADSVEKTTYIIYFAPEIIQRDNSLNNQS